MVDDFLVRAFLAGFGLTLATGPLGAFVVWRRMAYFGDATSHAAILGVALSFAFSLPLYAGILAVVVAVALTVSMLAGRGHQIDTALGVMQDPPRRNRLLGLGQRESLRFSKHADAFSELVPEDRLYQRL